MSPHLSSHLSDDELIRLLYGVGDADSHLAGCAECGERWDAMHRALGIARVESADTPEISGRMLAAQRQRIVERMERPSTGSFGWRWVPAGGAVAVLAAALILNRAPLVTAPVSSTPAAVNAEADSELFTDVYSMEQDVEPRAVAPIRALFQEASYEQEPK